MSRNFKIPQIFLNLSGTLSDIIYVAKDCVDFHFMEIDALYFHRESEGISLIEEILRGTMQTNPVTGNRMTDISDREWRNFLNQIDTVEEVIHREIEQEGKDNLMLADEQRAERRQHWEEQWEKFLANARLSCRDIPHEAESGHSLLIQEQSNIPYSEYMQDGAVVYNGVTFQCGDGYLALGDVSNPANVLTIPLACGGSLLVNRDCISQLGKAMGMFSAEDFGNILRAIAEDRKIQSVKYEMEEDENNTVNHLINGVSLE